MDFDPNVFRHWERNRHDLVAGEYADFFTAFTGQAIAPLLAACAIEPGQALLDVASGPGNVAAAASARLAEVTALDLSAAMLALGRARHAAVHYVEADAARLPLAASRFRAVVCNFGIGHIPEPERAAAEFARVLASGGRVALTWWNLPAVNRLQGTLIDAMQELNVSPPADLPPGPPVNRFADDAALQELFAGAGFVAVRVETFFRHHRANSASALWAGAKRSLARTGALIEGQAPAVQERLRVVFERRIADYADADGIALPISFKLASALKP